MKVTNQNSKIEANSHEHEHSGLSVGQGQSRVGNEPSVITTTPIVERTLQDAGEENKNIEHFFNVLVDRIGLFIEGTGFYEGWEVKDKQDAKTKFKEWFGISYDKYILLHTSSEASKTLTKSEIAACFKAINKIEQTIHFLLSKNDNYWQRNVITFLRGLETFLRSSNIVDQELVNNLQAFLDFKIEGKKLKQFLDDYKKEFPEMQEKEKTTRIRKKPLFLKQEPLVKELSVEEKNQKSVIEKALFISRVLNRCSTEADFLSLDDERINFPSSLDLNNLDEKGMNIVEQTQKCISAAKHYLNVKAKDKADLALEANKIEIVKVEEPVEKEVVSDAIQQKERIVVQKESNPGSKFVTAIVAIGCSFLGYGFVRMFLMSWANPILAALVFGSIGAVAYSKLSQREVSHIA